MNCAFTALRGHIRHDRWVSTDRTAVDELLLDAIPDWFAVTARLNEVIAEALGVGLTDLQCLHFLNRQGPATAGELARRVGRTTGAVTRMIDRLAASGFVRRVPSSTDRRSVRVEPTPEGLRRVLRQFDGIAARSRATLASYPDDQVAALLHFVRTSTEQARGELRDALESPS
jgi:DNA-binding MarR family transcriptional regulator